MDSTELSSNKRITHYNGWMCKYSRLLRLLTRKARAYMLAEDTHLLGSMGG